MRRWGRVVAIGVGLGWAVTMLIHLTAVSGSPVDAWCYYGFDPQRPWDPDGCFMYSPPIAQVMLGLQSLMPFEVFVGLLRIAEVGVLAVFAGPALGPLLLIPAVAIEINAANVNVLLIAAVVVGFRYPWAWAFVILTKVTPGIGLLWFAARREWRNLAMAAGTTGLIMAGSWALAPAMWGQFVQGLTSEPDASPFVLWWRLPLAAALVIWGARTDRRWTVVVAVFLAMPRWYYLSPVILVGLFPLVRLPRPLPWPASLLFRLSQTAVATSEGRTARAPSS